MRQRNNYVMPVQSMSARHILKNIAVALTIGIAAIGAYCSLVVFSARKYTIASVLPTTRATRYALSLEDLSPFQLDILLKVEDPQFFHHGGIDLSTPGAGITTITQGLVKVLYFRKFEPGIAKLKQTAIATFALDPLMPKEEQLRIFINIVYLGHSARGFEEAAHVYFHKSFKQLSEDEYIAIVATIIAPLVFDIQKFPARNAERVDRIKRVVNGEYKPRGLFDLYYGKLDADIQKNLPPFSYFESSYR
jgi:membrane peptidoglycan carboxypeptidase